MLFRSAFDEYFDEATRTVLAEVTRITHIVQAFTDFARLPAPSLGPTDLVAAARDVVGLHAAGGAKVELVSAPCPDVRADRDQVVQLLTNLVQNAIDAASAAASPRVIVDVRPVEGDRARLSVRDNGAGISPEIRARLFEPYVTTKPGGTGLGLAIAQRIAIEHGGEIGYADAAGGGTEFTVTLPVRGPTLLAEAPSSGLPGERT